MTKTSGGLGVLHLVDSLDAGGAERVAVELANGQSASGVRAHLCTTRRDGVLERLLAPGVGRLRLERTTRMSPRAMVQLAQYTRRNRIDILHAHSRSLFVATPVRAGCPSVRLVWHDHYGPACGGRGRSALPIRAIAAWIDGVVAASRPLAEWSTKRAGVRDDRVWYVPNGVATLAPTAPAPDLPGEPGARIVCVANIRPEKDLITLLRATRLVRRQVPAVSVLLVGAEGDEAYSRRLAQEVEALDLVGVVWRLGQRSDVAAVLAGSDVGVLSSRAEGLPLALLEYGAAGLATVATAVGQCEEVLAGGEAGILVRPGDPTSLSEALVSLLGSADRRAELGRLFRTRVERHYSMGRVIHDVDTVYRAVLAEAQGE